MAEEPEEVRGFSIEEEERILAARAKGRGKKSREFGGAPALTITSLMDLTTIILCFLLMTSQSQSVQPEMSEELTMPWSSALDAVEDSLTITITTQAVLVNNEHVVDVRDGDIPESVRVSATSPIIPSLQSRVEEVLHVEERWDVVRQAAGENFVTIIADDDTSYQVLTYVMMTASVAGVESFRFAVLHRDQGSLFTAAEL